MSRKRFVWALEGIEWHEESTLIGVYSSEELAKAGQLANAERRANAGRYAYDDYDITRMEVDQ